MGWVDANPNFAELGSQELKAIFKREYDEFHPRAAAPSDRRLERMRPIFESLWDINNPPEHWGPTGARWDPSVEPPRQHIRMPEHEEATGDEYERSETSTARQGSGDTERQFLPALEYSEEESDPYHLSEVFHDASMENEPVWSEWEGQFPEINHHEDIIGPHQSGLEAAFLGLDVDDQPTRFDRQTPGPDAHQSGLEVLAYYPTEEEFAQAHRNGYVYDEEAGDFVPLSFAGSA